MKLFLTGSLFLALLAAKSYAGDVIPICPTKALQDAAAKGGKAYCTCYPSVKYMICEQLDSNFTKNFVLDTHYYINRVLIQASPELPLLSEKFHPSLAKYLTIGSLKLIQIVSKEPAQAELNIEGLLPLVQDSLEIVANENQTILDMQRLEGQAKTLQSISISNVKLLKNFNPVAFSQLQSLRLNSVNFKINTGAGLEDLAFVNSALSHIEITDTDLDGTFLYKPKLPCKDSNGPIHIDLSKNSDLKNLTFEKLFEGGEDNTCKYHIDLSKSGLDFKFFTQNVKTLKPLKPDLLYLVLRDNAFECDQCVYDWYATRPGYVHSFECIQTGTNHTVYLDSANRTSLPKGAC